VKKTLNWHEFCVKGRYDVQRVALHVTVVGGSGTPSWKREKGGVLLGGEAVQQNTLYVAI